MQAQIEVNSTQITDLDSLNSTLQMDIQQIKEKNTLNQREQHAKFQEQLGDLNKSKDKEISFLQIEMKKLLEETEKVIKLTLFKKILNTLLK